VYPVDPALGSACLGLPALGHDGAMAKVIVVGGGAAGLVAAWRAASLGHQVQLLEANGRLGV